MLSRSDLDDVVRVPPSPEMLRRRQLAEDFRRDVLRELAATSAASAATSRDDTQRALASGIEVIVHPRLPDDVTGHRRASIHALVRLGRHDEKFLYAPVLIKNSEVVEDSHTRELLVGDLARPAPTQATLRHGVNVRSTVSLTRSGIALAHATRVLQSLGHGDDLARAALVDRHRRVWWLDLRGPHYARFNLDTYDALYLERRALVESLDAWREHAGPYPTSPYWHRECDDCTYRAHCHAQLAARDDVSLTHYTTFEQQRLLHEFGVDTRRDLARLDPLQATLARRSPRDATSRETILALAIERLGDLIYRARAQLAGQPLRRVASEAVGCPSADVQVDVDMESDGEHTYLWGAHVRLAPGVSGLEGVEGYHAFVSWERPTSDAETRIFAEFWRWFSSLRATCDARSLSFAAYCFWAQAEDGAMNRAVATPHEDGPTLEDIDAFRTQRPAQWIDLHELAASQIQTAGPLGLKVLARAAGFEWRDENPSGEASMAWFASAREGHDANEWRLRILAYNEDDCRATQALRDWLNGPARALAHRDEPGPW